MKRVLIAVLVLVMTIGLVACSSGGGTEVADKEGVKGEVGQKNSEPVTITFSVQPFASPQTVPAIQGYLDEFMKENPDIKVELSVAVNDDPYRVKLLQDVAANNAPDVSFLDGSWLAEFDALDALVPLDKWFTEDLQSQFFDFASEGATLGGEVKALWFHTGTSALYYRKDLLEEAGYSAPPTTWEELIAMSEKLTVDTNNDGIIDRYTLGMPGDKHVVTTFTLYPLFWSNPSNPEMTRDGKISFGAGEDKDAMVNTLSFISSLVDKKVVSPDLSAINFTDVESNFIGDQTAMAILGGWHYASIAENGGKDFIKNVGLAALPYPEGGSPKASAGGWTIAMLTKDEAKQEAAWKLMEYWATSGIQKELTLTGQLSTYKPIYEDEEIAARADIIQFRDVLLGGKTRDAVVEQSIIDQQFQTLIQSAAMQEPDLAGLVDTCYQEALEQASKLN